jgi:uncharacterized SAM-binding protein YcdF (DUF218 family)
MTFPRRRLWIAVLLVVLGAAYAGRSTVLTAMGNFLVRNDPPEKAEIIVVLAGDGTGSRIMKAVELVKQGYAPKILVDGPRGHYDVRESELAIEFAVRRGADPEIFQPFPINGQSTLEEAKSVHPELRRQGVGKAILVTSNFHTRRAGNIFDNQSANEIDYLVIAADYRDFQPDQWWRTRQGQKVLFLEYMKTLHSWLE